MNAMIDQKLENYNSLAELPSDMLEEVIGNLPTIDLLSASCISVDWLQAVHSSLRRRPRLFPWLVLRCLRRPKSSSSAIHALDPHSGTWLSITCRNPVGKQPPATPYFLCGWTRDKLYTLPFSKMVIFKDPFGTACQMEAKGPKFWRQDPVVAEVGRWIVVAGGGYITDLDEGEEEGAVEVYDKQTGMWELAQPMPRQFERFTYATWLSVAASDKRLYVIEKKTGWMSRFNPESKKWGPTRQMRLDQSISAWSVGISGKEKLLLVGAGRKEEEGKCVMKVRAWEVEGDVLRVIDNKSDEMPAEMADRLYPDFDSLDDARKRACSVELRGTERGGYIFDPANMKNGVVMYQLSMEEEEEEEEEGRTVKRWEWIQCPSTVGDHPMDEVSVGCASVTLTEVARCFV